MAYLKSCDWDVWISGGRSAVQRTSRGNVSTEESWASGRTQGDEKRVLFSDYRSLEAPALPFVIPTGAQRSGGTCGSAGLSWKCSWLFHLIS